MRERRRVLEDARAGLFRRGGEAERVIERMDVEGAREMHRAEIALVDQLGAHALGRPDFDLAPIQRSRSTLARLTRPSSLLETCSQPGVGSTPGMFSSSMARRT